MYPVIKIRRLGDLRTSIVELEPVYTSSREFRMSVGESGFLNKPVNEF
jgi:hypothetical protein